MTNASLPDNARATSALRYPLWAACAAWAGVIFWFSSRNGSQIPGRFSELGHFGEYFIFGMLLYSALRLSGRRESAAAAALVVASLYGMTDEFHQHFVWMRTPDVTDWGMDTVGAACGILASWAVAKIRRHSRSSQPAEKPA